MKRSLVTLLTSIFTSLTCYANTEFIKDRDHYTINLSGMSSKDKLQIMKSLEKIKKQIRSANDANSYVEVDGDFEYVDLDSVERQNQRAAATRTSR